MNDEIIGVITDIDDIDVSIQDIGELSVAMEIPTATGAVSTYEVHVVFDEGWQLVDMTYEDIVNAYLDGKELRLIDDDHGLMAYFNIVKNGTFYFSSMNETLIVRFAISPEEIIEQTNSVIESDPTVPAWAKAAQKPSYTAQEIGALPDDTPIPSKVSDLQNDAGYLSAETDPTVPAWAKAAQKPSYTAQEVGALPNDTPIPTVPSNVSAFTNDAGYLTAETDPTVPAWAKAAQKPSYTAQEVGAMPDNTQIPSKVSDLQNDSGFLTLATLPIYNGGVS